MPRSEQSLRQEKRSFLPEKSICPFTGSCWFHGMYLQVHQEIKNRQEITSSPRDYCKSNDYLIGHNYDGHVFHGPYFSRTVYLLSSISYNFMESQTTSYSSGHGCIPKNRLSSFSIDILQIKNKNVTFGKNFQRTFTWTDIKRTNFI